MSKYRVDRERVKWGSAIIRLQHSINSINNFSLGNFARSSVLFENILAKVVSRFEKIFCPRVWSGVLTEPFCMENQYGKVSLFDFCPD